MPADVEEMLTARRLEVLCDGVCDAVVLTFFERRRKYPSDGWMARQRRKIEGRVREIARIVGDGEWAVGDRFGLGDIAAGTVAGYLAVRFAEFRWRDAYPDLAALSHRLEDRPSFRDSVPVPQTIRDVVV